MSVIFLCITGEPKKQAFDYACKNTSRKALQFLDLNQCVLIHSWILVTGDWHTCIIIIIYGKKKGFSSDMQKQ